MYRDEELRDDILFDQRVSIQAAAYTIYLELTPNNKKPLTPREFRDKFIDNREIFGNMENKEKE
ncbi:MAG: hypothetical protein PUB97_09130 [Ruminococcus sp.]|nr:hypothetical protein [Ruminococcus sp.]